MKKNVPVLFVRRERNRRRKEKFGINLNMERNQMAYLNQYKETESEERLRAQRSLRYSEKMGTRLPRVLRPLVEKYLGGTILAEHDKFHGITAEHLERTPFAS